MRAKIGIEVPVLLSLRLKVFVALIRLASKVLGANVQTDTSADYVPVGKMQVSAPRLVATFSMAPWQVKVIPVPN